MAQIQIELTAEKENGNGYFYASLNLPATKMQIENAKQQARYTDSDTLYRDISVYESTDISLDNVRLDTTSIEELNFLAKRLDSMSRQEQIVYEALTGNYFFDKDSNDLVSVKDLINLTYGLDSVPVVQNIFDLEELGRFAVENDFITDLEEVPDSVLKYLDYVVIGQEQRDKDDGYLVRGCYVAFSIPTHHFLFYPGNINAKDYEEALMVEPNEYQLIRFSSQGTCLYRCGNERYLLQVIAPKYKSALFGKAGGR